MFKRVLIMEKEKDGINLHLMLTNETLAKNIKDIITLQETNEDLLPTLVLNKDGQPQPISLDDVVIIMDNDEQTNCILMQEEIITIPEHAGDPENLFTHRNAFVHTADLKDPVTSVHEMAGISWKQEYNYSRETLEVFMEEVLPNVTQPLEELYAMSPIELGKIVYPKENMPNEKDLMDVIKASVVDPEKPKADMIESLINKFMDDEDTTKH
jgi:hypothetical protein